MLAKIRRDVGHADAAARIALIRVRLPRRAQRFAVRAIVLTVCLEDLFGAGARRVVQGKQQVVVRNKRLGGNGYRGPCGGDRAFGVAPVHEDLAEVGPGLFLQGVQGQGGQAACLRLFVAQLGA
ncbi:hypothetical protein D3C71_1471770 [compost metagenome]